MSAKRPSRPSAKALKQLLVQVRDCRLCGGLPLGPKPILQAGPKARILVAGQAPGKRAREKGLPFDDVSGDRLRDWMGIDRAVFYDPARLAIIPMGFCFPGTGTGGDLPPRPECAPAWRQRLFDHLPNIELTLVIGRYALDWHLDLPKKATVTEVVRDWRAAWPAVLPLPHPSPRNIRWLKNNSWFETEVLPVLRARIAEILAAKA